MQTVKEKSNLNTNKVSGDKAYLIIKRSFDFISALLGLIILSPVMLVIAILIRLDSKGAIVFGHSRIGENGEEIKVYKFRSMVENAQEVFNNFTPEQKEDYNRNFYIGN